MSNRTRTMLLRALLVCGALAMLATTTAAGSAVLRSAAGAIAPHDASTILVKFNDPAAANAVIAAHGDRHLGRTATNVDIVGIAAGSSVDSKVSLYGSRRDVAYAEPNYIARASVLPMPNDPSYASDWGMTKIGVIDGWSSYPGAYVSTGGVPLAVVDTGVQAAHPDLVGRVQTASGANCVNPNDTCVSDPGDDNNGHGTHVAGITGAATNNALGVAGVAFSSPIIPVKVLNSGGSGSYGGIANGILWAVQGGAKAINLSLGGTGFSQTLCDAVTTAINSYGAVVVAAAGNSSSATPSYPAACPGAVGVAATNSTDGIPSFSNFGSPNVFVSAPGASIYSTYFNSGYATLSGTSMAAPFVTGLAALLLGQVPSRTPADVKRLLATTSDKVGAGMYGSDPYGTCGGCTWNQNYGYGRINAARALAAAGSPGSTTVTFSVGAGGDDGNVGAASASSYPPGVAAVGSSSGSVFTAGRRFVFGSYDVFAGLVRFDTSSLPDDATVTGATLRLFVTRTADADGRNFVGEWYGAASWPIDGGDYALSSTGSAFSAADITLIRAGASNDFALSGLGSVSKTGLTGLRLHVDGGQPTGDNVVKVASLEDGGLPKPQLLITYTR
jgi:thermitase